MILSDFIHEILICVIFILKTSRVGTKSSTARCSWLVELKMSSYYKNIEKTDGDGNCLKNILTLTKWRQNLMKSHYSIRDRAIRKTWCYGFAQASMAAFVSWKTHPRRVSPTIARYISPRTGRARGAHCLCWIHLCATESIIKTNLVAENHLRLSKLTLDSSFSIAFISWSEMAGMSRISQ